MRLSIHLHADGQVTFETTDEATVNQLREAVAAIVTPPGYHALQLVGAHAMADILRRAGRKHWAAVLAGEEEAHMVRVVFG